MRGMKKTAALMALLFLALPLVIQAKVADDAARLGAILSDLESHSGLDAAAWRTSSHEAYGVAVRIFTAAGTKAARELRAHLRQMRDAADKGDLDAARTQLEQAKPFLDEVLQAAAK
jgi:uncharacterized protein YukE